MAEAVLAKQFMFLNPDQLRIWNGPCRQFSTVLVAVGKPFSSSSKLWNASNTPRTEKRF